MNLYQSVSEAADAIARELSLATTPPEGQHYRVSFGPTGKLHADWESLRVWFEFINHDTEEVFWVTSDAEERAAVGETLVVAHTLEEALFGHLD